MMILVLKQPAFYLHIKEDDIGSLPLRNNKWQNTQSTPRQLGTPFSRSINKLPRGTAGPNLGHANLGTARSKDQN